MSRRVLGTTLLTAAILGPAGRFAIVEWINWTPLELPLVESKASFTREFTIERAGRYDVAVEIDRPDDVGRTHRAECLLGFDRADCSDIERLRIEWHLASDDGRTVAARRSSDGTFTQRTITRSIGTFDGETRGRYVIRVDVRSDVSQLRPHRPRLALIPSHRLNRAQHSLTAGIWLTSLMVGLVGFLLLDRHR